MTGQKQVEDPMEFYTKRAADLLLVVLALKKTTALYKGLPAETALPEEWWHMDARHDGRYQQAEKLVRDALKTEADLEEYWEDGIEEALYHLVHEEAITLITTLWYGNGLPNNRP